MIMNTPKAKNGITTKDKISFIQCVFLGNGKTKFIGKSFPSCFQSFRMLYRLNNFTFLCLFLNCQEMKRNKWQQFLNNFAKCCKYILLKSLFREMQQNVYLALLFLLHFTCFCLSSIPKRLF